MHLPSLAAAAAALLLPACLGDRYEVALESTPEGLRRELVWTRPSLDGRRLNPLPEEGLEALVEAYPGGRAESANGSLRVEGLFGAATPQDLGGFGRLHRHAGALGTVITYSERFRGADDLPARVRRIQRGSEVAASLLLAWFEPELSSSSEWSAFSAWASEELPRDLEHLALELLIHEASGAPRASWLAAGLEPGPAGRSSFVARGLQHLMERGYGDPAELLRVGAAHACWEEGVLEAGPAVDWLALVRGALRSKLELSDDGAVLALLSDPARMRAAYVRLLTETDWVERELVPWLEADPVGRGLDLAELDVELADPSNRLGAVWALLLAIPARTMTNFDELELRLACPREPLHTNGTWDAASGTLAWSALLDDDPQLAFSTPLVAHATWFEPDAATVRDLFGAAPPPARVSAAVVLWSGGLAPEQRAAWTSFLGSVPRARDAQVAALRGFRLQPGDEEPPYGARILADALELP